MKRLRIVVTGVKGGVGKTTVALYSALSLSRKYKVLLVDKDPLSFSSHILGFDAIGFLDSLGMKNLNESNYLSSINSNLDVFKYFSDPLTDRETFYKVYKMPEYEETLTKLFKRDYNFIIIDYGVIYDEFDDYTSHDYKIFRKYSQREMGYEVYALGVTDPLPEDISITIKYLNTLKDSVPFDEVLGVTINMVPLEDENMQKELERQKEEINKLLNTSVFTVHFLEEIASFKFIEKGFKEVSEMEQIVKHIESKLQ